MLETNKALRCYTPSAYSIESFAEENRHHTRNSLTKFFNRHRSVNLSTADSTHETAINPVSPSIATDLSEDQTLLHGAHQAKLIESSDKFHFSATCNIKNSECSLNPSSEIIPLSGILNQTDSCQSVNILPSTRRANSLTRQIQAASVASTLGAVSIQQINNTPSNFRNSNDSVNEDVLPLRTGPRLIHHSPPPWAVTGCDKSETENSDGASDIGFNSIDQTNDTINCNHSSRQSINQNNSKTGLKKLFKSVKVSLWSTPSTSHTDSHTKKITEENTIEPCPLRLSSSLNQSSVSEETSLDLQSKTTLDLNNLNNHSNTSGPDYSTTTPSRSISTSSICSSGTATTFTIPSTSITPSSSWSSLQAAQSDCPIVNQFMPRCHQDSLPTRTFSLNQAELNRHSNMTTSHHLLCTQTPSRCSESSAGASKPNTSQRILRSKPSFSFLHNLKRAVTGNDPTLTFSFNNHSTSSLTTSSVSHPMGTVLRNNGLDPLPPCHPLPLKSSQSSPAHLDCSSIAPTRLDLPRIESIMSPRTVSLFSYDLNHYSNTSMSPIYHPEEPHSETETLLVPPTLNLRPVSMPFAASFSDQFLFNGLNLTDTQEQDSTNATKKDLNPDSHGRQVCCPCCRSLADENVKLTNRIKELEMILRKNTFTTR